MLWRAGEHEALTATKWHALTDDHRWLERARSFAMHAAEQVD
jgi:hypothetical protein